MEPAAIITAVVGLLGVVGTGAWRLIDRADKKRERREIKMEDLLKERIASLEAEKLKLEAARMAERAEWAEERSRLRKSCSKIKIFAGKWREQLIANDIQPEPADWPEDDEHN